MGSYTAKAAIKKHLTDNWLTTKIVYPNEVPSDPWPPTATGTGGFPTRLPFVFFEIASLPGQSIRGAGTPGKQISVTQGFIYAHVFVPVGTGVATATQYAEQIGEIFRTKVLYNNGDGCYVRTWTPRVDEGGNGNADDDEIAPVNAGNYFRVTMSCPFQYWHRG
jgi:hypothetical protein